MDEQSPLRVLIVDDETEYTTTLAKVLRRRGLLVEVANDGLLALETLETRTFDVVLLDVRMPHLNGEQLLAELRHRHLETPVILMTGHLQAGGSDESLAEGAFAFLLKPYPIPDLLDLIGRAAAGARAKAG